MEEEVNEVAAPPLRVIGPWRVLAANGLTFSNADFCAFKETMVMHVVKKTQIKNLQK